MIYLRAPIDIVLERIKKRGRSFEKDIDPQYLKDLMSAYDRFFGSFHECPLLIVDTEELNFPAHPDHFQVIFEAIQQSSPTPIGNRHILTGPTRQPSLL